MYHVVLLYIVAQIDVPEKKRFRSVLDRTQWHSKKQSGTNCTDFDYAMLLTALSYADDVVQDRLNRVLDRRIQEFDNAVRMFSEQSNHTISNYLSATAVFQRLVPDRFEGPVLRDVLHEPKLFIL